MDMLKALVPVEMTLASNVALRYLCQKAEMLGIGLQPIHVEEPDHKPHSSETGWIRKSWESGLKQAGLEEVQRILQNERLECFVMPNPIVRVGSREEEILSELRLGGHDLFVEGEVANFNTNEFRKRLRSKLYRQMPCPALIVRNMIYSNHIAITLDEKTDMNHLADTFCHLFADKKIDLDICAYAMDDLNQSPHPEELLSEAKEIMTKRGFKPLKTFSLLGSPESAAKSLHDYGMLVVNINRKSNRKSPLTEVLGLASNPILFCW